MKKAMASTGVSGTDMGSYFSSYSTYSNQEWLERSMIWSARPWWPQRCIVSNKLLWLKKAVLVRRVITGPGTPVVIDRWVESKTYTMQTLKGWD